MDNCLKAAGSASREPIAITILQRLSSLADFALNTATRLEGRFESVVMPDKPSPETDGKQLIEDYPSLFHEIRTRINIIDNALNRLNNLADRAEL